MISQKARYAFKALTALARAAPGTSLQIGTIASGEAIPRAFLEQIMLVLKQARLVESRRGRQGGYQLARSAETIFAGEILRLVDGPPCSLPCLGTAGGSCPDCRDTSACALRLTFRKAYRTMLDEIDGISLAETVRAVGKAGRTAPAFGDHPFSGAYI